MTRERGDAGQSIGPQQHSTTDDLPPEVAELVDELAAMPGAVAVVLGGSRGQGAADAASDWDLGLYYRGSIGLDALERRGTVFPPGSWGRVMNGGAWLRDGGVKVDILLRDLDVVEHWTRRATDGEFEVDLLLGYIAGIPTYSLAAELATCRPLRGSIPRVGPFPPALATAAPPHWRFRRALSLDYARMQARRGNVVAAAGQAAKAVLEEAHARACERGLWVLNEKRLIDAAELAPVHPLFTHLPPDPAALTAWVESVAHVLGASPDEPRPWA